MGNDYLWVWADRSRGVTVLKVRGELDASTAARFAADAARELRQTVGLIAVDLSFLDFLDCTGARALAAMVRSVPAWRVTEVRGIQPPVARLLELTRTNLSAAPRRGEPLRSVRGQELMARAAVIRAQSQEVLLETSAAMDRLATTCAGLALVQQRHAEQEEARTARMQTLSETARDLADRFRERALCVTAGNG